MSRKINSRLSSKQGFHEAISYGKKKGYNASNFNNDLAKEILLSHETFDDLNDLLNFSRSYLPANYTVSPIILNISGKESTILLK